MAPLPVQAVPQTLYDVLGIKGGRLGLSFVPQILPVIDIQQHLLTAAAEWISVTTAVTGAGQFIGHQVPDNESWTPLIIGSVTDVMDADQAITLQTAIQRANGDLVTVSFGQTISASMQGGRGDVLLPVRIGPGDSVGILVNLSVNGAGVAIPLTVSCLRTIERV